MKISADQSCPITSANDECNKNAWLSFFEQIANDQSNNNIIAKNEKIPSFKRATDDFDPILLLSSIMEQPNCDSPHLLTLARNEDKDDSTEMMPFPMKLHRVLDDAQNKGFEHILSWQSNNIFKVHDVKAFSDEIMPQYFPSQSKYRSFQRQLNLYEFERIMKGPLKGAYRHCIFQRSCSNFQLSRMRINKNKGNARKEPPSPIKTARKIETYRDGDGVLNKVFDDSEKFMNPPQKDSEHQEKESINSRKEQARQARKKKPKSVGLFEGKLFYTI